VLKPVPSKYFMRSTANSGSFPSTRVLAEHLNSRTPGELIMDTGEILEIDSRGGAKAGKVTVGHVCIDSGSVGDVVQGDGSATGGISRRTGSCCRLWRSTAYGRMEGFPEIVSRGFAVAEDSSGFIEMAKQIRI